MKIEDYDIWFKPCEKCGFDTGRVAERRLSRFVHRERCWKCGGFLVRDFSDRALKPSPELTDPATTATNPTICV